METLIRINKQFNNLLNVIKTKKSSDLLIHVKNELHSLGCELSLLSKNSSDDYVRALAMEAFLTLLSTKLLPLSLNEKKNTLQQVFDKLQPVNLRNECVFVYLRIQNLLCYYLIQQEKIHQARAILEIVEDMYTMINKGKPCMYLDAKDLFEAEPVNKIKCVHPEKIDKLITNNIQMQTYIYNKLKMDDKYTLYNHTVLRRQLEMKEGTPQEWALRTARLGNYFTYMNEMYNARHHLCAAYNILRTCHENAKLIPDEFIRQKADFEVNFLEISHYWVKYGLTIFKLSKKRILNKYFGQTSQMNWPKSTDLVDEEVKKSVDEETLDDSGLEKNGEGDMLKEKALFNFPTLNVSELESRVPVKLVFDIVEAKKLFSFTHKWLTRAKNYYDMQHYPSEYISCCLQLAELFEHVAFFERDVDRQYSLQKRRADVLESLNSLLKTSNELSTVQIDVIRELSQVQLELMALNLQKLWREESQTNFFNPNSDNESLFHEGSVSDNTLTKKNLNTISKSMFLKKMEAATSLSGKLFRLSGQLNSNPPSELSLYSNISMFK